MPHTEIILHMRPIGRLTAFDCRISTTVARDSKSYVSTLYGGTRSVGQEQPGLQAGGVHGRGMQPPIKHLGNIESTLGNIESTLGNVQSTLDKI